jgi:hydroxymethylglutaryl-CoA lyase
MSSAVKIIECPRDAWQGLPTLIPSEVKVEYLRSLIDAGFRHIDAVSFVSPRAVPQMADSERVLELLHPPQSVEIIGIVVNRKGAERAIATGKVSTLGFPYSISPEFLRRNQKQTQKESLLELEKVVALANVAMLDVVVYISMAFGNPYGEPWSTADVLNAANCIAGFGVGELSLADTVGVATPRQIEQVFTAIAAECPELEIGVHLHARRDDSASRIRTAYDAGCRRFDSALGGLGGCTFAQDALVSNIPTELLIATLTERGADLPKPPNLDHLVRRSAELAERPAQADAQ